MGNGAHLKEQTFFQQDSIGIFSKGGT